MTTTTTTTEADIGTDVQNGLEFILSHLSPPHFPRTIMTYKLGRQIFVHRIDEAIRYYRESDFLDCRISAYPPRPLILCTRYLGGGLSPNVIMIDIDKSRFTTERAYKSAVSKTLKNIEVELNGNPTVIWSGNGSHIIQPITAVVLEELSLFSPAVTDIDQPSVKFLRWAEGYLSAGKSDPAHKRTLSFGNCMLRVPGSHNSKCVNASNSVLDSEKTMVKIIQKWNGHRPNMMLLIGSFHAYLVDKKIKQSQREQQQQRRQRQKYNSTTSTEITLGMIPWIEKLLTMSISDNRKYCIWRILSPYLVNVKKLTDEQANYIIVEWLEKCNSVKRLSFDGTSRIRYDLQSARKKGFYPIGWEQLKIENTVLYNLINN
jgi:Primase X